MIRIFCDRLTSELVGQVIMAPQRLGELSSIIAANTAKLEEIVTSEGLSYPSFDAALPSGLLKDEEAIAARQSILEATDELHALMLGPAGILTSFPV